MGHLIFKKNLSGWDPHFFFQNNYLFLSPLARLPICFSFFFFLFFLFSSFSSFFSTHGHLHFSPPPTSNHLLCGTVDYPPCRTRTPVTASSDDDLCALQAMHGLDELQCLFRPFLTISLAVIAILHHESRRKLSRFPM